MFSAQDIVAENALPGTDWDTVLVGAPPTSDRPTAPGGFAYNGYTDSTQQQYNDRIQGYTGRPSYELGESGREKVDEKRCQEPFSGILGLPRGLSVVSSSSLSAERTDVLIWC
jgi:hypothetical protein